MLTVTAIAGTNGKPGVMNITLLLKQKGKYRELALRSLNHFMVGYASQFTRITWDRGLRIILPILRLSTDDEKYTDYGKEK